MSETVKRNFRVDGFVNDLVWLELEEGSKRGLQFAVPTESPEYGPKLEDEIDRLNEGDQITATLVSENERNTAWRFSSIKNERATRKRAVADD